jgi:hypothetical protein
MRLLPSCLMVKVHVKAVRVDPRSVHVTCGGHTGTDVSPSTSVLIPSVSVRTHSHLHVSVTRRTKGESLVIFQKSRCRSEFGVNWIENNLHYFLHQGIERCERRRVCKLYAVREV